MPRRKNHRQLRVSRQQLRPRFHERRFFALQRAARNHESQPRRIRLQQPRSLSLFRRAHIELQISGHRNPLRRAAQRDQALGIDLALRQHRAQPAQQRLPQPPQHVVTRPRAIGDPRVHHRDRNSAAKASVQQIRPELRLRQHQHARLERLQIRAHRPRQVERAIEHSIRSEPLPRQRLSRSRGCRNRHKVSRQRRIQRLHQPRHSQHFAHAHRMHPDQRPVSRSRASNHPLRNASQPLPQSFPVLLGRRHAPQPPRRTGHERREQGHVIEKQRHAVPIRSSAGLIQKSLIRFVGWFTLE